MSDEAPRVPSGPGQMVAALIRQRWLLVQWARRDFNVRYRQSALGPLWALVQPTVLLAFYGLLLVRALGVTADRGPYLLFAWCGLSSWTFVVSAISGGASSLVNAQALLSKVYFPRETVPLAAVLVAGVDLLISSAVLVVLALVLGVGIAPSALALVPIYASLMMIVGGVATFAATLAVFARDVLQALPLVLQVAFIATPVMYPSNIIPGHLSWVHRWNPIAQLIEQVRIVVLDGQWPSLASLGGYFLLGAAALTIAILHLRSIEHRLPDIV